MRGQLQTMEPIVVIIVLAVLLAAALPFVFRIVGDQDKELVQRISNSEAEEALFVLARMPELSCPSSESSGTPCLDSAKVRAFSTLMQNDGVRLRYYPILGAANITLFSLDLRSGAMEQQGMYDALTRPERTGVMRTYFTLYDPSSGQHDFAMLEIAREIP